MKEKEVITRLFSHRLYIKLSVDISPRLCLGLTLKLAIWADIKQSCYPLSTNL